MIEAGFASSSDLDVTSSLQDLIEDETATPSRLRASAPETSKLLDRLQDAFFRAKSLLAEGGWESEQQQAILFVFVAGFHTLRSAVLLAQHGYQYDATVLSRILCDKGHLCEYLRRTCWAKQYLESERAPTTTEVRKELDLFRWAGYHELGAFVHARFEAVASYLKGERPGQMDFGWGPNPDRDRFIKASVNILVFSLALLQSTTLAFDCLAQDEAFSDHLDNLTQDVVGFVETQVGSET